MWCCGPESMRKEVSRSWFEYHAIKGASPVDVTPSYELCDPDSGGLGAPSKHRELTRKPKHSYRPIAY
jgi:hypothetical protein